MTAPWLSVLSVVKDDPAGMERTLKSLVTQDLDRVQWVVVDSSVDREVIPNIIQDFPGHIDYSWTTPQGIYPAMNHALTLAHGKFSYFANAGDEFFAPNVVRYVGERIQDSLWAYGPVEIVETTGLRVFTPHWNYDQEKARLFARGSFPPHQGTFARTGALVSLGGFDPRFTVAADYHMALKLSQVADPSYLPLVVARFYEGGKSTQERRKSLDEFHSARLDVYALTARQRVIEQLDTRVLRAAHWIAPKRAQLFSRTA